MQFEKFTIKAQEAVSAANTITMDNGNQEIAAEQAERNADM